MKGDIKVARIFRHTFSDYPQVKGKKSMKPVTLILSVLTFLNAVEGQVRAGFTINFDTYQRNNTSNDTGAYDWGTRIGINGFTITSTPNPAPGAQQWSTLSTLGPLHPAYPGVPAMYNRQSGGGLILATSDGTAFSLNSIDLVQLPSFTSMGMPLLSPSGEFSVTFYGTRANGEVVTSTATVLEFGVDSHLQTFTFSGFTNLVSVNWYQGPGGYYDSAGVWYGSGTHEFDNIVVDKVSPVPIPSNLSLIATMVIPFAGHVGLRKLRKRGHPRILPEQNGCP